MGCKSDRTRNLAELRSGCVAALLMCAVVLTGGCDTAYYGIQEQFGNLKSDILVERVTSAMAEQEDASAEFADALEKFEAVVGTQPSALKDRYQDLRAAYEDAAQQAAAVSARIDAVAAVAEDLFEEWAQEIEQISQPKLRHASAAQLELARDQYAKLIAAMRQAESRMQPVLIAFNDHVLYLKHNLNAAAIASLRGELRGVEADVRRLVKDMERAIRQAQQFLRDFV